jgi:hypothetical protein
LVESGRRSRMRSAFESPLKLSDGVVEVCGPLGWDAGETEAVVMAVIVRQEGDQVVVGTASSPPNFSTSDDEWMLNVQPTPANKEFMEGPARATGVIRATGEGVTDVLNWSQVVWLKTGA